MVNQTNNMVNKLKDKHFLLLSLILALIYSLPLLLHPHDLGVRDWDLFTTIAGVPVGSIIYYGQFPFWNMYMGGGNILFHHPEVLILSPFFVLYLIFGELVGLKLQVFLCYFLGFYGSFKLFGRLGMSKLVSFTMAIVYFGSVHFALHFAEGHMPFTHFCFLPWFVYYIHKSIDHTKYIIGAVVALTLMILGNGAAIPFLYTMTFSSLLFLLLALQTKKVKYFLNYIYATLGALALSAVKFIPMIIYLMQNKWEGNPEEVIPLSALGDIFFGLKHSLFTKTFLGQIWGWHEYGAYISPLVILFLIYTLVIKFKKFYPYLILLIFFLILGLGNFGKLSLWSLLSHLPGFSSARCTGRSFQLVILSAAIIGGFGFDLLRDRLQKFNIYLKAIPYLLLLIVAGTNIYLSYPIISSAARNEVPPISRHEEFRNVIDSKPQAYRNYLANQGSLVSPWLSAYHPSRALVGPDNVVYSEYIKSGEAQVIAKNYTPNRIEYTLNAQTAGSIIIGMGYDRGWSEQSGVKLYRDQDLIAFDFEPGENRYILTYQTPYFYPSLVISLITLLFLIVYGYKNRSPKSLS